MHAWPSKRCKTEIPVLADGLDEPCGEWDGATVERWGVVEVG